MLLKLEDKPQPEVLEEILQKVKVVFCTDGRSRRAKMANSVRGKLLPGTKTPNLKQYPLIRWVITQQSALSLSGSM